MAVDDKPFEANPMGKIEAVTHMLLLKGKMIIGRYFNMRCYQLYSYCRYTYLFRNSEFLCMLQIIIPINFYVQSFKGNILFILSRALGRTKCFVEGNQVPFDG